VVVVVFTVVYVVEVDVRVLEPCAKTSPTCAEKPINTMSAKTVTRTAASLLRGHSPPSSSLGARAAAPDQPRRLLSLKDEAPVDRVHIHCLELLHVDPHRYHYREKDE
jgi:hypothetical protein